MIVGDSIMIFGGPYSNLEATEAVLAEAARRCIPPDRVICTGDVVAYGADAKACVQLMRQTGIRVVMGNCEERLASHASDCGCGFAPGSMCDRLSEAWFSHARAELDEEDRGWMGSLPRRLNLTIAGLRLAVIHGSLSEISRFVFASTPGRVKSMDLIHSGMDGIVGGHSGLPFTQAIDGRLWHNPGVVGMPANDGTPRVWFSVLSPGPEFRSLVVEHNFINYDHTAAAAKMRHAHLPEEYASALSTGLWASCDVLPPVESESAGQTLVPGSVIWRRDRPGDTSAWPRTATEAALNPAKFLNPHSTALGERRAKVPLSGLKTLWINTGRFVTWHAQIVTSNRHPGMIGSSTFRQPKSLPILRKSNAMISQLSSLALRAASRL